MGKDGKKLSLVLEPISTDPLEEEKEREMLLMRHPTLQAHVGRGRSFTLNELRSYDTDVSHLKNLYLHVAASLFYNYI